MFQTILTFRDFIKEDHKKQFAFLPLQLETCMLMKVVEEDEKGVSHIVLHIFDSKTHYIGTVKDPHWIPGKE